MLSVGDYYPAGLACFDRTAITVLWSIAASANAFALVYTVFFIAMIQKSAEHKFGRTALGVGALVCALLSFAMAVVRAVHPEWTFGSDVLSSALFSAALIAFWAFICAVILRVITLSKRVQKFQSDGTKSILVERSMWIYVLYSFALCINLLPVIMLSVDQSLPALTALAVTFYWGFAICILCTGGFALQLILVPLCEAFKAHVANRATVPGAAESTAQMSIVVAKMDRFARFIEVNAVFSFLAMALFGSWPILLRASSYYLPVIATPGPFVIVACLNLFWPVSKTAGTAGTRSIAIADTGSAASASVPMQMPV